MNIATKNEDIEKYKALAPNSMLDSRLTKRNGFKLNTSLKKGLKFKRIPDN